MPVIKSVIDVFVHFRLINSFYIQSYGCLLNSQKWKSADNPSLPRDSEWRDIQTSSVVKLASQKAFNNWYMRLNLLNKIIAIVFIKHKCVNVCLKSCDLGSVHLTPLILGAVKEFLFAVPFL